MKKWTDMFQPDYDDPEEQAQAEKEERVFKRVMTCSFILMVILTLLIILIMLYVSFAQ